VWGKLITGTGDNYSWCEGKAMTETVYNYSSLLAEKLYKVTGTGTGDNFSLRGGKLITGTGYNYSLCDVKGWNKN
jgi:hypothetical protein